MRAMTALFESTSLDAKQSPIIGPSQSRIEPGLKPFLRKLPSLDLRQNYRPDQDLASRIVFAFTA